jgi:hypothetical protein
VKKLKISDAIHGAALILLFLILAYIHGRIDGRKAAYKEMGNKVKKQSCKSH